MNRSIVSLLSFGFLALVSAAEAAPDIVPYKPNGWSAPIVIAKTSDTFTDSGNLQTTDDLWFSYAIANLGDTATSTAVEVWLYVDDVLRLKFTSNDPVQPNTYSSYEHYNLGKFAAGTHKLKIRADATNAADESSETNNQFTKTITVTNPDGCSIHFNDVPKTNPFYAAIRCVVCNGWMSGFSDETFRPNNASTRAQTAMALSKAAGFANPVSGQTFADVPPGSPAYKEIERLAERHIVGSYKCGGDGEPCDGKNRPYFRPGNPVTRAQFVKMLALAKGFENPVSGQTFDDVPPSSPFYVFVERIARRGILGGYACGGPGEPCDGKQRPYFRPFNQATRGIVAKALANAFGNCTQSSSSEETAADR